MLALRQIHNVKHPFIDTIYLKKEFGKGAPKDGMDVLVIKPRHVNKGQERNQMLLSFLADLDLIKDQVERKAGKFNRVDIRYS
jgi:hypothetical protein